MTARPAESFGPASSGAWTTTWSSSPGMLSMVLQFGQGPCCPANLSLTVKRFLHPGQTTLIGMPGTRRRKETFGVRAAGAPASGAGSSYWRSAAGRQEPRPPRTAVAARRLMPAPAAQPRGRRRFPGVCASDVELARQTTSKAPAIHPPSAEAPLIIRRDAPSQGRPKPALDRCSQDHGVLLFSRVFFQTWLSPK